MGASNTQRLIEAAATEGTIDLGGIQTTANGADKAGFFGTAPATKPTALTAAAVAAASFTHTAPSSDDFAIQALTDSGGFGFKTADEGHSVLKALKNAILRIEELEDKLQAIGLLT